jgi:hypothetical protein
VRLLCEASETARCEALFYARLKTVTPLPAPRCLFCDYSEASGEFVLLSAVVPYGGKDGRTSILPAKHRVRDVTTLEEQRCYVAAGAALNAALWGADHPSLQGMPRYETTHVGLWSLAQLMGRLGLRRTVRRDLGAGENTGGFMTWEPPPELVGREADLISDLPALLGSLCRDRPGLVAYGHNDIVADNAFLWRDGAGGLSVGLFDWQQACVNNLGQEYAWNFHFLPPEFLTAHEEELIDLLLSTWAAYGRPVDKAAFLECYALGSLQM